MRSNLLLPSFAAFLLSSACAPLEHEESPQLSVTRSRVSSARTLIGDIDGFGISPTTGLVRADDSHKLPADTNQDGRISPGEFLPDWNKDGHVSVGGKDNFDRRSEDEKQAKHGAQWTDRALTGDGAANGAQFIFDFTPPARGQPGYEVDHFINFVFGDYDIDPASIKVDGVKVPLTVQSKNKDGLVQIAYAMVPWTSMTDGRVIIEVIAPNEPYLAFDYALLDIDKIADCDSDGIPDTFDNCPCTSNPDQVDLDGDQVGDVCDPGCHVKADCDDGDACTADSCTNDENNTGVCSHEEQCPDCSAAAATMTALWPPNHKQIAVQVTGVTDPQGQTTHIRIDGITQDEPTDDLGDGRTCPDASGLGTSTAMLRAERSGLGDGRVYHLSFTATDPDGYSCSGLVTSCVPHDMGHDTLCGDQGPLYDSLVCSR